LAMCPDEDDPAQDLERLVHVGEIRMAIARLGEDRAERARALLEKCGNIRIDGATAEVGREGGANGAEIDIAKRLGNVLDIAAGKGIDLVAIHLRLEQE